jgi:hypothetical protein
MLKARAIALGLIVAGAASPAFAAICTDSIGAIVPFQTVGIGVTQTCKTFDIDFTVNTNGLVNVSGVEVKGSAKDPIFSAILNGNASPQTYTISDVSYGPGPSDQYPKGSFGGVSDLLTSKTYDLSLTFTSNAPAQLFLSTSFVSAVPLPPALALFGGGLAGLIFLALWRKGAESRALA